MFIVDSHCHLDALDYEKLHENISDVVAKAHAREVKHLLAIGVTLSRFEKAYDEERLLRLAQDKKVVAIGEIGLDYYYSSENKAAQQAVFAAQIQVANQLNKPVIIHTREAREDTIRLLRDNHADKCGGVLHCFTENEDMAKKALDLGFYISISGIVTFKNAEEIRNVVRKLPLDRLLVETDSPYLAPVPYRGKQNQPAYTREVCEYLAALKGVSIEEMARVTTENFERLFKIHVQ